MIKSESDEEHETIPPAELVKVFVGPTNDTPFSCSRHNLAQSTVLTSRITTPRDSTQPYSFIMDPTFRDIQPSDFKAVVQFLNAHEYEPLLLSSPSGELSLDDSSGPIDYPADLLRSGHLFNLAKRFQLPAFGDLVARKVLHGHRTYDTRAFLAFAAIVLRYQEVDFRDGEQIRGVLEGWVVQFLAEHMHTLCSRVVRDARVFWELMRVRGVEERVLERRLRLCRRFPAQLKKFSLTRDLLLVHISL